MNNFYDLDNQNKNGFDNINDTNIPTFLLFSNDNQNNKSFNIMSNNIINNNINFKDIENKFFNNNNINYIQKELISRVYMKTNKKYKIIEQNILKIRSIMNQIYEYYFKYTNENINIQLTKLNEKTLSILVKQVLNHLSQYNKYSYDINNFLNNNVGNLYKDNTNNFLNTNTKGTKIIDISNRLQDLYN